MCGNKGLTSSRPLGFVSFACWFLFLGVLSFSHFSARISQSLGDSRQWFFGNRFVAGEFYLCELWERIMEFGQVSVRFFVCSCPALSLLLFFVGILLCIRVGTCEPPVLASRSCASPGRVALAAACIRMKTVRIFFDRIRDRIRLEGF
jgi:hypothetical protein